LALNVTLCLLRALSLAQRGVQLGLQLGGTTRQPLPLVVHCRQL
jgi:hypothetical protein